MTEERQAAEARAVREVRSRGDLARVVATFGTALGDLARGRLSGRIETAFPADYESLRPDFNAASGTLAEVLASVVQSADSIRTEANEIASATNDLNRRTEQQAATLEQTAAALDELTASVQSAAAVAEVGRGFAVVASEVRALAQRS